MDEEERRYVVNITVPGLSGVTIMIVASRDEIAEVVKEVRDIMEEIASPRDVSRRLMKLEAKNKGIEKDVN